MIAILKHWRCHGATRSLVSCLWLCLTILLATGCHAVAPATTQPATTAPASSPIAVPAVRASLDWRRAFRGIELAHATTASTRPMRIFAAKIDLHEPGLRFLATPPVDEGALPVRSQKVSAFLVEHRCQLAINTSPFDPVFDEEGKPQKVTGLAISEGKSYGEATPANIANRGALMITRGNRVRITRPPYDLKDVFNAAGGFGMVLEGGRNVGSLNDLHPRTGAGVSRDGRWLYLIVIDGRQPLVSEGATTAELGAWLARMGAWDAVNLDGGGSTAMVVAGDDGRPRVLNRPIHKNVPGTERPNANALGVFAPALERK
ncbi:MAG: phosphodiester glycosidase family protein [Planctomycetota bacterium]|nr:phosphodiester glycosidase family protein [Planctomycetota bacterium]